MFERYKKWILLFLFATFLLACPKNVVAAREPILDEVRNLIKHNYVDAVSSNVLQASSVLETLKRLGDPYARYYTKKEFDREMEELNGQFTGIGVYYHPGAQGAQVFGLIPGSPAEKAGIKENDLIIEAAGKSLAGLDSDRVSAIIRGPVDSSLELKVKRNGQLLTIKVIRKEIQVPSVEGTSLNENTGLLALSEFGSHSGEEMAKAIKDLKGKKADRWILDMRDNPGGFLETALDVAGFFIGDGDTVIVKERKDKETYPGQLSDQYVDGPLIVLVNENSASAAEIVTAALKDQQRALIMGHTTYGKGTVQDMFELSNGDRLKFTIARFYSPLDQAINGIGVKPDIEISDKQALKAAELLMYDIPTSYQGSIVRLEVNDFAISVDPLRARRAEYWAAWSEVIKGCGGGKISVGSENNGWTELSKEELAAKWPLYYPGYEYKGEINYRDQALVVDFLRDVKPSYLNGSNIELINAANGESIKLDFSSDTDKQIVVKPKKQLSAGDYWLVINNAFLRFIDGQKLDKGLLATIQVSK